MGWACRPYGERKGAYMVLVVKNERKRQLGRPGCKWENNIKNDLKEVKGRFEID